MTSTNAPAPTHPKPKLHLSDLDEDALRLVVKFASHSRGSPSLPDCKSLFAMHKCKLFRNFVHRAIDAWVNKLELQGDGWRGLAPNLVKASITFRFYCWCDAFSNKEYELEGLWMNSHKPTWMLLVESVAPEPLPRMDWDLDPFTMDGWATDTLTRASDCLKSDEEFALHVVRKRGRFLRVLALSIRRTKRLVLEAVRRDGSALEFASEALQEDEDVVLAAVQNMGWALNFSRPHIRRNRDIVLAAVRKEGWALVYASIDLQGDKEVVLEAVQQNGWALQCASVALQDDRDVVLAAVQQDGKAMVYASKRLRDDKLIVLESVRRAGEAMHVMVSAKLWEDADVKAALEEQQERVSARWQRRGASEFHGTLHVLVGAPRSGKTTWAAKHKKEECHGFASSELRKMVHLRGIILGDIAISTTGKKHISMDNVTLISQVRDLVKSALGDWKGSFRICVIRF